MNRRRGPWVLGVLSLFGSLPPLGAQTTPQVVPGAIVRWRDPADTNAQGRVIWIRNDSLSASVGASSVTMALAAHPDLQVRGGPRSHAPGTLVGLGVGAAIGTALGSIHICFTPTGCNAGGVNPRAFALFTVIGGLIGEFRDPGYHWKRLRPGQLVGAVQVRPMVAWSHGPALGVSIQF